MLKEDENKNTYQPLLISARGPIKPYGNQDETEIVDVAPKITSVVKKEKKFTRAATTMKLRAEINEIKRDIQGKRMSQLENRSTTRNRREGNKSMTSKQFLEDLNMGDLSMKDRGPDKFDKLYKTKTKAQMEKELAEIKEKMELENCTFIPQVNKNTEFDGNRDDSPV